MRYDMMRLGRCVESYKFTLNLFILGELSERKVSGIGIGIGYYI